VKPYINVKKDVYEFSVLREQSLFLAPGSVKSKIEDVSAGRYDNRGI
jgi:hypothetical protein